jgi:hypothetical protein
MRYILVLLLAASCSPIYIPNTRNVPLFKEGGEFQAAVYGTTGGADVQAAYALSDHVALMGNYSYGSKKVKTPLEYTRKNSFAELGLGYFKVKRHSRFELFAGYGMGQGTSYDTYYFFGLNNDVIATGKFQRIFFQPSIGSNNKNFNIAFTPRFSWMKYNEFSYTASTVTPDEKYQLFIEPAVTGKFHLSGNLHGIIQLGLNIASPADPYFNYQPLQFAFGLQLDTSNRLRTKVYR